MYIMLLTAVPVLVQLDRQAAREQAELAKSDEPPEAGGLSFSRVSGLQR